MTKQKRDNRGPYGGGARNDLTQEQAEEARQLIDNIGGDTWNEGDYQWNFTAVRCDFGAQSCSMDITVNDHDTGGEARRSFQRSGNVYGLTGYSDMVEGNQQTGPRLVPDFYSKVADLVEYLEKTIPRR